MASQVSSVCRSAYYHLFRIAKIRASLTVVACKTLVHALVISRVDYGNALYGITDRLLHRLEMIQHSAARIIINVHQATRSPKHNGCASTPTLATCEVAHPLQDRCSGVPRPPWSGASVRNYADYVVRATSRPTISWYRSVVCPSP